VRNKREDEVPHLAAMLRVKRTEAGRQWWQRSTSATGGRRRRRQAPVRQWRGGPGIKESSGELWARRRERKRWSGTPHQRREATTTNNRAAADLSGGGTHGARRGCGRLEGVRKDSCRALGGSYRARRGGGATAGQQWPLMAMVPVGCLKAFKGRRLIRENRMENWWGG
jgi:hypothetical protein